MKAPDSNPTRSRPRRSRIQRSYDDRDLLHRLYVERGMTIAEIARELGATSVTIQKYLKKHEIPSRGRGPRKGRRHSRSGEHPNPPQISESLRAALLAIVRTAIEADDSQRLDVLRVLEQQIDSA